MSQSFLPRANIFMSEMLMGIDFEILKSYIFTQITHFSSLSGFLLLNQPTYHIVFEYFLCDIEQSLHYVLWNILLTPVSKIIDSNISESTQSGVYWRSLWEDESIQYIGTWEGDQEETWCSMGYINSFFKMRYMAIEWSVENR